MYSLLQDPEKARISFEKAIDVEPDKAKFHRGIAQVYYDLKEHQEAAEHAFTSIELVKFYPAAHFILGKSLEKLGDLENAKAAYENARKLNTKTFHLVDRAIENVDKKMQASPELIYKIEYGYYQNQIVIVSGLPRS